MPVRRSTNEHFHYESQQYSVCFQILEMTMRLLGEPARCRFQRETRNLQSIEHGAAAPIGGTTSVATTRVFRMTGIAKTGTKAVPGLV